MSNPRKNFIQKLAGMRIRTRIIELLPPNFAQAIFRMKDGKFVCNHASPDLKFLKGLDFAAAEKLMTDSKKRWKRLW